MYESNELDGPNHKAGVYGLVQLVHGYTRAAGHGVGFTSGLYGQVSIASQQRAGRVHISAIDRPTRYDSTIQLSLESTHGVSRSTGLSRCSQETRQSVNAERSMDLSRPVHSSWGSNETSGPASYSEYTDAWGREVEQVVGWEWRNEGAATCFAATSGSNGQVHWNARAECTFCLFICPIHATGPIDLLLGFDSEWELFHLFR